MLNETRGKDQYLYAHDDIKIVDNPNLKNFFRDIAEWSFTLTFWAFWIYLLLPVINLIVWLLVGKTIFKTVIVDAGYKELVDILAKWGIATLGAIVAFISWGYYNYWVFGRKARRKSVSPAALEEIASFFQASPETISCMQGSRIMEIAVEGPKKPGAIKSFKNSKVHYC